MSNNDIRNDVALNPYIEQAQKMLDEEKYEELLKWIEGVICACVGAKGNDLACLCIMRQVAASKITGASILKSKILEKTSKSAG
jgi:hypothetical protein